MSDTLVSVAEAKTILIRTVMSVGYTAELAEDLVSSALWLEARGAKGIRQLIVYLLLIKDKTQEDLRPQKDDEHAVRAICPIMTANVLANKIGNEAKVPDGVIAVRGPASVLLMAPILTALANVFDRNLRLWFGDTQISFSNEGWALESDGMISLFMFDHKAKDPTGISFIPKADGPLPDQIISPFERLETVALPTARMTDTGILNLSGEKLT